MIYDVCHATRIQYKGAARLARFNLRLQPAPWPGQTLHHQELIVDPLPDTNLVSFGPYHVVRNRLVLKQPITQLKLVSRFTVEVDDPTFLLQSVSPPDIRQIRSAALQHDGLDAHAPSAYLYASTIAGPSAAIAGWARPHLPDDANILEAGRALMSAIHAQFRYDADATRTDTPPQTVFETRRGVCQDFAHVMIVAARAHGIPAAYVSGYLRTRPPPGMPRLVGADAMHAWAALWCGEQLGWVGFDPTNNCLADASHIFVAMGRDYADVAPLDGVFHGGTGQTMDLSVDVVPRLTDGRVSAA